MNARERLIDALQNEIDNADFSTEESQDDSYQFALNKIIEIIREHFDDSITLHDIVGVVDNLDNLEITLQEAYVDAIAFLNRGF